MIQEGSWFDTLERVIELSSTPGELESSFPLIADCLQETFPCDDCRILIYSPQNSTLTLRGASPSVKATEGVKLPANEGVIGYLYEHQHPLFVRDVSHLPFKPSKSEAAFLSLAPMELFPIADNGFLYGILYLRNLKVAPLGANEAKTLSLICRILAGLLRTARVYGSTREPIVGYEGEGSLHEGERGACDLSFLNEASMALLATMGLDHILYTVLTAITLDQGLGFNRAMVFLVDEHEHVLKGEMAIGPDNPTEAQRIWTALSTKPEQKLADLVGNLEKRSEASQLNEWVRQMSIPTEGSMCILERTFTEGRSFVARTRYQSETSTSPICPIQGHPTMSPACDIHRQMIPRDFSYDCATVPLWGRAKAIGTIWVDNIFNHKSIRRDEIRLLEVFAKQASLAIEHSMVLQGIELTNRELRRSQEMLIQNEKMAALRQMAANVAHAIKNPLVSIGGFARRLDKTLDPNTSTKKYTQTLIRETTRLEGILNGILDYSIKVKPQLGTHDFNEIVRSALNELAKMRRETEILVVKDLEPDLPEICCDDQQIRQIVLNILFNGVDAMNGQGKLSVKTYSFRQNGRGWVAAEIMDSGDGIPQEVLPNIFNPFFSTQSKETGLGLAICHRIATSHHGSIDVDNRPGQGVRFIVKLPQDQREEAIGPTGAVVDSM